MRDTAQGPRTSLSPLHFTASGRAVVLECDECGSSGLPERLGEACDVCGKAQLVWRLLAANGDNRQVREEEAAALVSREWRIEAAAQKHAELARRLPLDPSDDQIGRVANGEPPGIPGSQIVVKEPKVVPDVPPPPRPPPVADRPPPVVHPPPEPPAPSLAGPIVTAICSFFLPGLGQLFLGQFLKGVLIILFALGTLSGFGIVNVLAAADAFELAKKKGSGKSLGSWECF